MTNNIPYVSSKVMDKVIKIGAKKHRFNYEDVGLVMLQHRKKTYKKQGREVASDLMDFVIFDHNMNKLGVVKRKEIKGYYRGGKTEKGKSEKTNQTGS